MNKANPARREEEFSAGWASRGFKTGALSGGPTDDIVIGAPNAACGQKWSSAIIRSFVVIGEPGRDVDGVDGANDGQVYVYKLN